MSIRSARPLDRRRRLHFRSPASCAWRRSAAAPACPTCCADCAPLLYAARRGATSASAPINWSPSSRPPTMAAVQAGCAREFGVIPPGDIRNCLAAMAADQSLLTAVFQFRFESGDGLNGHALGNLMLTALDRGHRRLRAGGRDRGARGRRPRPRRPGDDRAGDAVGRTSSTAGRWRGDGDRRPPAARSGACRCSRPRRACVDTALDALRRADVIVAGPGSLYTSILPPLLMPEILEAIRLADAGAGLRAESDDRAGRDRRSSMRCDTSRWCGNISGSSLSIASSSTRRRFPITLADQLCRGAARCRSWSGRATSRALRDLGVEALAPRSRARGQPEGPAPPGRLAAAIAACAQVEPANRARAETRSN